MDREWLYDWVFLVVFFLIAAGVLSVCAVL